MNEKIKALIEKVYEIFKTLVPAKHLSEPQKQDVIVVSEKGWRPIFQEFANEVREHNKNLA